MQPVQTKAENPGSKPKINLFTKVRLNFLAWKREKLREKMIWETKLKSAERMILYDKIKEIENKEEEIRRKAEQIKSN